MKNKRKQDTSKSLNEHNLVEKKNFPSEHAHEKEKTHNTNSNKLIQKERGKKNEPESQNKKVEN